MKIIVAVDSFKDCMSSIEIGNVVKDFILEEDKGHEVIVKPVADGGEGTVEALIEGLGGEIIDIEVKGPLSGTVIAKYGITLDKTAIIEMASASGLMLVPPDSRNPFNTTTFGVGEIILDAIKKGCKKFIVGIGGSATNDCGLGMLSALGCKFFDKNNNEVGINGKDLGDVERIERSELIENIKGCEFFVACDVDNPLYGENGASFVYGPQKGATKEDIYILDNNMKKFSGVIEMEYKIFNSEYKGVGAAGGLGYAFLTFLNAKLLPGTEIILDYINIEKDIIDADIIITGEGRMDFQTIMGKTPIGVARLSKKYNKPVIAIAGSVREKALICNENGIDAFFSIMTAPILLEDALKKENTIKNLKLTVSQIFKLIKVIKN